MIHRDRVGYRAGLEAAPHADSVLTVKHPIRSIGATAAGVLAVAFVLGWLELNLSEAHDLAWWATFWNAAAAIGTMGATITVVWLAWREVDRDRRREDQERRAQANKVDVRLREEVPPDEELAPWPDGGMAPTRSIVVVEVRNYSDLPIAEVIAGVTIGGSVVSPYGGPPNPDPSYLGKDWSARPITDSDLVPAYSLRESSPVHVPERTIATPVSFRFELRFIQSSAWAEPTFAAYVVFTDFSGNRWRRSSDFALRRIAPHE